MKKKCMALFLCLLLSGFMALTGCGSSSEEQSFSVETMESLCGTTVEATVYSVTNKTKKFEIYFQMTVDGDTGVVGETYEIDDSDGDYETAADYADECYGLTDSSVADLEKGDTVTITFDEEGSICALVIE